MSDESLPGLRHSLERAGLTNVRRLATFGPGGGVVHHAPPRPELTPAMRGALGSLPPRQRTAIELHYGLRDGRSWSFIEIGRRLGVSSDNARRMVENARQRLRWLVEA